MERWNDTGLEEQLRYLFLPVIPCRRHLEVEIAAQVKLFGKHLKAEFDAAAYIVRSAGAV